MKPTKYIIVLLIGAAILGLGWAMKYNNNDVGRLVMSFGFLIIGSALFAFIWKFLK